VFGRVSHVGHSDHAGEQHQLRRRALLSLAIAAMLAALALLIAPPHARGNFVYWSNSDGNSLGRAKINGTGLNNSFVTGVTSPWGIAVDSKYIYWEQPGSIGRANLDGSAPNPNFVTGATGVGGLAVTSNAIFYNTAPNTIGRANIDGTSQVPNFIDAGATTNVCGIAADQNFVYWSDTSNSRIGRATVGGGSPDPGFVPGAGSTNCGIAVDSNFIYWGTIPAVARAPIGGGAATVNFIPNAVDPTKVVCGVAVSPQYLFWGSTAPSGPYAIGRANVSGSGPNPNFLSGLPNRPCMVAAAPSNKITINSVVRKKKKGTAAINAKVPGPGQVTLNQTSTPPDANATAAAVKQIGLTIPQASSFTLAVKPVGKTAKKLNKQIKKQLRKKRKARATVKQTVFIHFVPAGVAGVPNTQQVNVTLVKQRTKKH
jgi:hypothetical protein